MSNNALTVQQHILQEQSRVEGASGQFSWLLSGITLATKMIQEKVRRAGVNEILGSFEAINVQGEEQQKLDVYANEVMPSALSVRESVGLLASEENDHPHSVHYDSPNARYAIVFDPLDGSSNIDVNVSVGTTFGIWRRPDNVGLDEEQQWVLQPGKDMVAAGYVVYGSSTILVYSVGNGVHGFTLDPHIGAYMLSHENIRMPSQGKYYSVNEAYRDQFPPVYRDYIEQLRTGASGASYGSRYIGSMVADFHRTLLKGGVFMYPPTKKQPDGKLRLMYEANPIAFLAEQAGGHALAGKQRIMDIIPEDVHQRTSVIVGSEHEMSVFRRCWQNAT
jgi:fructose-1,6-bisphosphatase I